MAGKVVELDAGNFDKFVSKGKAVVDFYAEWCGPCQMMKPVFEEIAGQDKNKINFGKVNTENEGELSGKFDVLSIPTLIFFKDGKEVGRNSGFVDSKSLKNMLKEIF